MEGSDEERFPERFWDMSFPTAGPSDGEEDEAREASTGLWATWGSLPALLVGWECPWHWP